jgi:hypothetical protein
MGLRWRFARSVAVWLIVEQAVLWGQVTPLSGDTRCRDCNEVIRRIEKLLPRRPEKVVVIDTGREPPGFQRQIRHAEGFTIPGDTTVYLKKQGPTFQRALQGAGIWDYAVAIIVWHEMAHIDGADEPIAERQEETLWQAYVVEGRVDASRGLKYLKLLQARH